MEKQIRVKPRERWTCTSLYIKKKDILGVREEVRSHFACTTNFLPGEGSIYTLRVSLGLSQSKCTERTVMGTRPVELSEGALMKPRKKRKEEKKRKKKKEGEQQQAALQSDKLRKCRQCSVKLKGRKATPE